MTESVKILWVSQHQPTTTQRAELTRLFPSHTIVIDPKAFDDVRDIVARYESSKATEMVLVAPLTVVRALTRRGINPLWAEMEQTLATDARAEVHIKNRHYRFVKFHRCVGVTMELVEVIPAPTPILDSTITDAQLVNITNSLKEIK